MFTQERVRKLFWLGGEKGVRIWKYKTFHHLCSTPNILGWTWNVKRMEQMKNLHITFIGET